MHLQTILPRSALHGIRAGIRHMEQYAIYSGQVLKSFLDPSLLTNPDKFANLIEKGKELEEIAVQFETEFKKELDPVNLLTDRDPFATSRHMLEAWEKRWVSPK